MTVFYPDISHYQAGLSLAGAPLVVAKITEGISYLDPAYDRFAGQAHERAIPILPYHYLHAGNARAQANFAHSVASRYRDHPPIMLDVENGNIDDVLQFIDEYQSLGGRVALLYLPHWQWEAMGRPSLVGLPPLVASHYSSFEGGAGWMSYGGATPSIWQYTDAGRFNGVPLDMNAFRGTLMSLLTLIFGGDPVTNPLTPAQTGQ